MIEAVPNPENRYGWLTDSVFEAWWNSALTVDDQERAVHVYHANLLHCRFACAFDTLRTNHDDGGNLIVRAYCAAAYVPEDLANDHENRVNAQYVLEHPSVRWMLDQVTYRSARIAEQRIRRRTARRLEKLYDATETEDGTPKIDEEHADLHRVVLDGSAKFLAIAQRDRIADAAAREKIAVAHALATGRSSESAENVLPTPESVRILMLQLRENLGDVAFAQIVAEVAPKKLT